MNKTAFKWDYARKWTQDHPGQTAAVVTPQGTFRITFEAKPKPLPLWAHSIACDLNREDDEDWEGNPRRCTCGSEEPVGIERTPQDTAQFHADMEKINRSRARDGGCNRKEDEVD